MRFVQFISGACAAAILIVAVGIVSAKTWEANRDAAINRGRACVLAAGSGWTEVDCSAAAAYSAALTKNTRYIAQAVVGSPYMAIATAGSGQDADSSDGYLPVGEWLLFATPPSETQYITCDGSADSSKLRYLECQ